jgi:pyrroline-5-carboxylate reductase
MTTSPVILIGAGRMGTALLSGWIARKLGPVIAVEPSPSPALKKLAARNRVKLLRDVSALPKGPVRACVVALKPQVLKGYAGELTAIAKSGATMISIAAGTTTDSLKKAWGPKAHIVRAMPNTPGAIGRGIAGLYAAKGTRAKDKALAEQLLAALGETVWVKRETLIDSITAVSGSGPAYVFLFVEALARAAEAEGLPRAVAEKLARATVSGSGALLDADPAPPAELRRAVTSPGGTTEAAIQVLMANDAMAALVARAVEAARRRAAELSG